MKDTIKDITVKAILQTGIIPLFYHDDAAVCKKVAGACFEGGVRVFEFVNRGPMAEDNFQLLKRFAKENYPAGIIGAGSILTVAQAERFINLGAGFIVSPVLNEDVARICNKHGVGWIPGCATPTEIAKAAGLGAGIIKVFPGNVLGPGFIKSVLAPMPGLKLMPTGGVEPTRENLSAWFGAGAVAVGMGSKLIDKEMTAKPELLTGKVKEIIKTIKHLSGKDE
jgi:2-dehydro-3-deoxyphosphogluconate aldolase/(4S)-4-hydroxy-2-oxoglutarate aldolase